MSIRKPFRGTQLNPNHPLTRGLVNCTPMWEGVGKTAIDVSRRSQYAGTDVSWGVAKGVNGALFNGSSSKFLNSDFPTDLTGLLTVEIWFTNDAMSGFRNLIQRVGGWYIMTNGTFVLVRIYPDNGFGPALVALTEGALHQVVMTFDGATTKFFIDGTFDNSAARTGAIGSTGVVHIGAWGGSSEFLDGSIHSINVWNRALNPGEIKSLYADPYQMFDRDLDISYLTELAILTGNPWYYYLQEREGFE